MRKNVKRVVALGAIGATGLIVGYLRGYDDGVDDGIAIGQIRELIQQGYSLEDAVFIIKNRSRHHVNHEELLDDVQ